MFWYFSEYTFGIQTMQKSDIIEIDSLEELAEIDRNYRSYITTNDKTEDETNE